MYPFVLAFYRTRQSLNHRDLTHSKASETNETGEANVLQEYPLWIVSLWKGGGNFPAICLSLSSHFPDCFFKALGCFCTEENMLLFILSVAQNDCNIIILRM